MRRSLPMTRLLALAVCGVALLSGSPALAQTPATPDAPAATKNGPTAPSKGTPPSPDAPPPAAAPLPTPAAPAATGPGVEELVKPVNALSTSLEAAEKNLEQSPGSQRDLSTLRNGIEKIEIGAREAADALRPHLDEVRSQIKKLGDPPKENEPPEAEDVASERQRLNGIAAQIDGAIKKAGLIEERSRQLIGRVQNARKGIFTRFLLRQTDTPLQAHVWREGAAQLHLARRQLGFILGNWWSAAKLNSVGLLGVLAAAFFAFIGLHAATRRMFRARLDAAGASTPSTPERALNAAWVALAMALPLAAALAITYVGLDELGLLYWQVERFAHSAVYPLLVMICVMALARAVLQPKRPRWRVFALDDASARTLSFAVQGIAVVYALDYLCRRLVSILSLPLSASILAAFFASLLYALLLFLIVRTPLTPPSNAPGIRVSRWRPYWLKSLLIALAVTLLGAALLGYVTLGRFIVTQLLTTGAGVFFVGLLHVAIKALVPATSEQPAAGMSAIIGQRFKLDELGRTQLTRVERVLLNFALFAIAVPLLLLSWGLSWPEITSWLRGAIFGFDVGGVRISLARILAAVALFAGVLVATRFVQRWLAAGALAKGRVEPGLANSIYTGAGYVGFAVAALAAISYAGFDITSLAIVAGALSVGIGFGLQSIVNNFVSGLILLVERPIKVGDWVSLKEGEGYVRRIAVRSTEIETFGRASLIVPNSELITQTVVNLTHRNLLGRLKINVRVSYQSDPEQVLRVLQQVAEKNTSILRHPPPVVVLDNLGENAMDFSVRVFLADINRSLQAQTELRTGIVKALRAEGIDIPFANALTGHAHVAAAEPGRASIDIAVAQDADPAAVLAALGEAARQVGAQGEGVQVAFVDIADSALEFTLSVPLPDGVTASDAQTVLRVHAVKALRSRGIDLASPQRQVRLRDLEGVRTFLTRMVEERMQREGAEGPSAPQHKPDDQ